MCKVKVSICKASIFQQDPARNGKACYVSSICLSCYLAPRPRACNSAKLELERARMKSHYFDARTLFCFTLRKWITRLSRASGVFGDFSMQLQGLISGRQLLSWPFRGAPHRTFFARTTLCTFGGTSNKVNRPWFRDSSATNLIQGRQEPELTTSETLASTQSGSVICEFLRNQEFTSPPFHTASSDVTSFMGNDSRDFSRFRRSRPEAGKRVRGGKKIRDTHTHSGKDSLRRTYVDCFLENGEFSTIAIRPSFAVPPNLVHQFGDHCRRRRRRRV